MDKIEDIMTNEDIMRNTFDTAINYANSRDIADFDEYTEIVLAFLHGLYLYKD